jgi:spermidine/putrescine transport system permease protein
LENARKECPVIKGWGLTTYAILFIAFVYGPVLILPLFSFNDSTFATFPLAGFTTRHYVEMWGQGPMIAALVNSLKIGLGVTLLTTAIAIPAAISITRFRFPGKPAILSMLMLPLVVPSIVLAVALLVIILRFLDIPLSLWTVAAGHVLIALPFCTSVLMSRLEGFDRSLEEASRDLGSPPMQTFWRVTFPLALPGIISSLLLGFIISFDEFVIAFFLTGTDNTLPVYLYSQLRFPNRLPGALALGSLILVVSTVLVIVSEIIRKRGVQSDNPGDV